MNTSHFTPYKIFDSLLGKIVVTGSWWKICRFMEKHDFDNRYHVHAATIEG